MFFIALIFKIQKVLVVHCFFPLDQEFIIRILSHKAVTINGNGVNIDDLPAHVLSGATYKEVTIFKTSRLVWGIR